MRPYEVNIAQVDAEFSAYTAILKRERVKSYLEIGSKFGGSLWRASQVMDPGSRIVAIDLPNGTKAWRESSSSLEACNLDLKKLGYDVAVIWADSQAADTVEKVRSLGPFDAVMIDADHRLPGVTADWKNYGPMGRIVAFHDIAWKRAPEWQGVRIDVPQFWESIKNGYRYEEFKLCPTGKNNGIGVLWRC